MSAFRSSYLDHDALTAQLDRWARAYPSFVRKSAIGRTTRGRELWLLTIGRGLRPVKWCTMTR